MKTIDAPGDASVAGAPPSVGDGAGVFAVDIVGVGWVSVDSLTAGAVSSDAVVAVGGMDVAETVVAIVVSGSGVDTGAGSWPQETSNNGTMITNSQREGM